MPNKRIVFQTEWFSIEAEDFPNIAALGGKPIYRMNIPESVVLVSFTNEEQLILVRQFRPAIEKKTLELPAGSIDPKETPVQAAERELIEESGYRCHGLTHVATGNAVIDRVRGEVHIFYGDQAVKECDPLHNEGTETVLVSMPELKRAAVEGRFHQLSALSAILLVKWKLDPSPLRDLF